MPGKVIASYDVRVVIRQSEDTTEVPATLTNKQLETAVRAAVIDAGEYLEEEVNATSTRTDQ